MTAPQELYYKMTNLDGTDFWTGRINYALALETDTIIRHPTSAVINTSNDSTYLSVATSPGDTFGNGVTFGRVFRIEPVGEVKRLPWHERENPNWRGVLAMRVVEEIPMAKAYGPNGELLLEFAGVVRRAPEEFFWALAKNYAPPLPEGIGWQIREVTYHSGVFAAALASRIYIGGAAMHHAPKGMTDDLKASAIQAFLDTAWGIITRGLIAPRYTTVCTRTWRKTFGADYA